MRALRGRLAQVVYRRTNSNRAKKRNVCTAPDAGENTGAELGIVNPENLAAPHDERHVQEAVEGDKEQFRRVHWYGAQIDYQCAAQHSPREKLEQGSEPDRAGTHDRGRGPHVLHLHHSVPLVASAAVQENKAREERVRGVCGQNPVRSNRIRWRVRVEAGADASPQSVCI